MHLLGYLFVGFDLLLKAITGRERFL